MNYYISDLHFGHENCIKFDNRPFANADEMDAALIANWNAVVRDEDDVYILGDVCFRSEKRPSWYIKQLKGRKHLIIGNHDKALLQDEEAMQEFVSVDKMTYVKDGNYTIVLCHFPIAEWNQSHHGSWHIYGHIHKNTQGCYSYIKDKRALNAGCMINHYTPATIKQLVTNNQMFRENYLEELYGDHEGLMELEDGTWIFPSKIMNKDGEKEEFMDEGDIHWAFSEWFRTGLIYHFYIDGERDHEHTFEAVMRAAYEHADTFEIREEDRQEYSAQELNYLKTIVEKSRR